MPRFTVHIAADHTGTAYSHEIDAATPWLALEKSQARFGWLGAELFDRGRLVARVAHLPQQSSGVWQIIPALPPLPVAEG